MTQVLRFSFLLRCRLNVECTNYSLYSRLRSCIPLLVIFRFNGKSKWSFFDLWMFVELSGFSKRRVLPLSRDKRVDSQTISLATRVEICDLSGSQVTLRVVYFLCTFYSGLLCCRLSVGSRMTTSEFLYMNSPLTKYV